MALDGHGDLAIAELVFYVPAVALALWVAFRHGFSKQAGWIFLAILALVRIIGPSMLLAYEHKPSKSLLIGAIVLDNIGISPLLLAMLGILKRVFVSHFHDLLVYSLSTKLTITAQEPKHAQTGPPSARL